MLALEIDNPVVEKILHSKYDKIDDIKEYFYNFVINDLLSSKDAESKKVLASINRGLEDIECGRVKPIEKLWEELDD